LRNRVLGALNPHPPAQALVNRGNVAFSEERYEAAADDYRAALALEPACTEALYNLGCDDAPRNYDDAVR
jgi:tetratricopeptide (TPR) repeat protein